MKLKSTLEDLPELNVMLFCSLPYPVVLRGGESLLIRLDLNVIRACSCRKRREGNLS